MNYSIDITVATKRDHCRMPYDYIDRDAYETLLRRTV